MLKRQEKTRQAKQKLKKAKISTKGSRTIIKGKKFINVLRAVEHWPHFFKNEKDKWAKYLQKKKMLKYQKSNSWNVLKKPIVLIYKSLKQSQKLQNKFVFKRMEKHGSQVWGY